MLLLIILALLLFSIGGGIWGQSRVGYAGWSPFGIILVTLVVLYFTGYLHR